jgi:dimeric dUTPase (all-alpha-NTP-PPase superfamily)
MLAEIFARQLELQTGSMGIDPRSVMGAQRYIYLLNNFEGIADELAEARAETNWKMWTHGVELGTFHDRDAFVKELVDLLHFLVNLLLLADASADEVYNRYMAKASVNARRQDEAYDGRSTKDATGRATDEPDIDREEES